MFHPLFFYIIYFVPIKAPGEQTGQDILIFFLLLLFPFLFFPLPPLIRAAPGIITGLANGKGSAGNGMAAARETRAQGLTTLSKMADAVAMVTKNIIGASTTPVTTPALTKLL